RALGQAAQLNQKWVGEVVPGFQVRFAHGAAGNVGGDILKRGPGQVPEQKPIQFAPIGTSRRRHDSAPVSAVPASPSVLTDNGGALHHGSPPRPLMVKGWAAWIAGFNR